LQTKAVIFDIGGVLLSLGEAEYRRGMALKLGLQHMPPQYEQAIPYLQRGELAEEDLLRDICGLRIHVDRFDEDWRAHFRPVPAMLALADELRCRGMRTAILSNTQPSHVRIMRTMGFLEGFSPVVMSCEAGYRKPEPAAYRFVLERLGLEPESVAYVDDGAEYVAVAARLGIRSILHKGDAHATREALLALES